MQAFDDSGSEIDEEPGNSGYASDTSITKENPKKRTQETSSKKFATPQEEFIFYAKKNAMSGAKLDHAATMKMSKDLSRFNELDPDQQENILTLMRYDHEHEASAQAITNSIINGAALFASTKLPNFVVKKIRGDNLINKAINRATVTFMDKIPKWLDTPISIASSIFNIYSDSKFEMDDLKTPETNETHETKTKQSAWQEELNKEEEFKPFIPNANATKVEEEKNNNGSSPTKIHEPTSP